MQPASGVPLAIKRTSLGKDRVSHKIDLAALAQLSAITQNPRRLPTGRSIIPLAAQWPVQWTPAVIMRLGGPKAHGRLRAPAACTIPPDALNLRCGCRRGQRKGQGRRRRDRERQQRRRANCGSQNPGQHDRSLQEKSLILQTQRGRLGSLVRDRTTIAEGRPFCEAHNSGTIRRSRRCSRIAA